MSQQGHGIVTDQLKAQPLYQHEDTSGLAQDLATEVFPAADKDGQTQTWLEDRETTDRAPPGSEVLRAVTLPGPCEGQFSSLHCAQPSKRFSVGAASVHREIPRCLCNHWAGAVNDGQ